MSARETLHAHKMNRALVLLALVGCCLGQSGFFQIPQRGFQGGRPQNRQQFQQGGGGEVDDRNGNSLYHYSWRRGRSQMSGQQAFGYCRSLGGGWAPVSINDGAEDSFITRVIAGERLEYIWTGGSRAGRGWAWADGSGVGYSNWSSTGGSRRPQPDNREGNESCLAILNNFYRDGITWHDVACSHLKPTICERRA